MKKPLLSRLITLYFICLLILSVPSFSQNSVGIGTANSNDHAVLELVSPNSNQGFLVPRLTTAQRTAAAFINSLAASENGLLVYDSELNVFFHWLNNQWTEMGKAQDLSLVGNTLKITNNPNATPIDLSPYAGTNTDNQTLSISGSTLSIAGGNSVDISSINTDAQNLSSAIAGTQRTINISGGTGTTIDVADNDNSITNEIQNLTNTIAGTQRTINISGGTGTTIDVADNDNSITNEIQNLTNTIAGTQRTINISGGTGTTIDVADNDNSITNEIQNLSNTIAGTQRTINISGGTGTTIDVADNDNSVTNEIQTLALAGSTLSITGGNSVILPTGGVTGTGATDQVTFWAGASTITGANSFKWDSKNSRLGVNTVTPLGNLHVTGSHFASTTSTNAAYTIAVSDYIVSDSPPAGVSYNITLPDANANIGRILIIRTSGNAVNKNNINVIRAGADTLDGGVSINLDATVGKVYAITVVSVGGARWITISKSAF
jgi:hypothetical protein